jgi:hypothetical protein
VYRVNAHTYQGHGSFDGSLPYSSVYCMFGTDVTAAGNGCATATSDGCASAASYHCGTGICDTGTVAKFVSSLD